MKIKYFYSFLSALLNPKNLNIISLWREEKDKKRFYCFNCDAEYEFPTKFKNFYISKKYLNSMICPQCEDKITELKGLLKWIRIPIRPFLILAVWVMIIMSIVWYFLKCGK